MRYCERCEKVQVRKRFCPGCRKTITLERLSNKWYTDAAYREKHKIAARLSFRRTHMVTETRV